MTNPDTANWVDPDIIAYYEESGGVSSFDFDLEKEFKEFFEIGWNDPKYDDLRETWDKHLIDESPHARVLAKTALWSVVRLREVQGR